MRCREINRYVVDSAAAALAGAVECRDSVSSANWSFRYLRNRRVDSRRTARNRGYPVVLSVGRASGRIKTARFRH